MLATLVKFCAQVIDIYALKTLHYTFYSQLDEHFLTQGTIQGII